MRVDNETELEASITTSYAGCGSGHFDVEAGNQRSEWRGWCLVTEIDAVMHNGTGTIRAISYVSSGTGYALFRVVKMGNGDFCVGRVNTDQCS